MTDRRIRIVADEAIPFLTGVFEPYSDVEYLPAEEIVPETVKDADVLMPLTLTRCDAALLEGSRVRMISSPTIGVDHIDMDWCDSRGIVVRNAPGTNAGGVCQYVFSALYGTAARVPVDLKGKTIGIIGVGHVGKRVEINGLSLGFKILKYDPPRAKEEGDFEFCDLDRLLAESDIVTLHVPLNRETRGMADDAFFRKMKKGAFFINTARGEIVDDEALKRAIPRLGPVVIDTWNHEPDIDRELLDMVVVATPHIAGYSYQGKQNGTAVAVRAVARYFGLAGLTDFFPETDLPENRAVKLDLHGKSQGEIAAVFQYNYPIFTDDFMFRLDPGKFEELRRNYHLRSEVYVG